MWASESMLEGFKFSAPKLDHLLEMLCVDKNGDGVVDLAEFIAAGGSAEEFAELDLDNDGVVDGDEMEMGAEDLIAEETALENDLLAEFDKYDLDGDGQLDEIEMEARAVDKYDVDGDGMLDAAEMEARSRGENAERRVFMDGNKDGTVDRGEFLAAGNEANHLGKAGSQRVVGVTGRK